MSNIERRVSAIEAVLIPSAHPGCEILFDLGDQASDEQRRAFAEKLATAECDGSDVIVVCAMPEKSADAHDKPRTKGA
jgi:hypothetical protein